MQDGFSVKEERPVPQCQAGGEKRALDLVRRKAMGKLEALVKWGPGSASPTVEESEESTGNECG